MGDILDLFFRDLNRVGKLLTPEEEMDLIVRAKKGDIRARNRIIEGNLKFVVKILIDEFGLWGWGIYEGVNEGVLGMIEAIKNYDPKRKIKFISYAVWYVRKRIKQFLNDLNFIVKVPYNIKIEVAKLERPEDIKDERVLKGYYSYGYSSLDEPLGEKGVLGDRLSGEYIDPGENLEKEEFLQEFARTIYTRLNPVERYVLMHYFSFLEPKTVGQMAGELGYSYERIRQILGNAIAKIKEDKAFVRILTEGVKSAVLYEEIYPNSKIKIKKRSFYAREKTGGKSTGFAIRQFRRNLKKSKRNSKKDIPQAKRDL
ncbi:MAG: sigma-70 family RNA polymerase sigma factor [Candidatus Aenigmatarchaeota archaeon]